VAFNVKTVTVVKFYPTGQKQVNAKKANLSFLKQLWGDEQTNNAMTFN